MRARERFTLPALSVCLFFTRLASAPVISRMPSTAVEKSWDVFLFLNMSASFFSFDSQSTPRKYPRCPICLWTHYLKSATFFSTPLAFIEPKGEPRSFFIPTMIFFIFGKDNCLLRWPFRQFFYAKSPIFFCFSPYFCPVFWKLAEFRQLAGQMHHWLILIK